MTIMQLAAALSLLSAALALLFWLYIRKHPNPSTGMLISLLLLQGLPLLATAYLVSARRLLLAAGNADAKPSTTIAR